MMMNGNKKRMRNDNDINPEMFEHFFPTLIELPIMTLMRVFWTQWENKQ
jgi:hypothetical protein